METNCPHCGSAYTPQHGLGSSCANCEKLQAGRPDRIPGFKRKKYLEGRTIVTILFISLLIVIGIGMGLRYLLVHKIDEGAQIEDGRILLIGSIVLAVISGRLAPSIFGGRYSYTLMISVTLIVGAINLIVGNNLWDTNSPDPQDCVSFSLTFCGGIGLMDLIILLVIGMFGWAARKDSE